MSAPPSGRALVLTYVALLALTAISLGAATHHGGTAVALAIATLKVSAIALVFMELAGADAADRMIAAVAVFFVVLLCVGAVADVALR